jgi:Spy/CpxP family protein refolding chaperone
MKQQKTIRFLAILGVLALLTGGLTALAQQGGGQGYGRRGGGPGGPGGPGHGMARLADELDLSEEQREQVRGILKSYHEGELGETMEAMREAREGLRDVVHDSSATEDQVREAVAPIATLEEKLALLQHQVSLEIDAVLTEEQRAKAAELREQRPERRGRGRGYRGRGGPPSAS